MFPDWQALFAPRPLTERGMVLSGNGSAPSLRFAFASPADLVSLSVERFLTSTEAARAGAFKFGPPQENFTLGRLAGKLALVAVDAGQRVGASGPLTPALSPDGGEGAALAQRLRAFEIGNGERGEPVVRPDDLQSPHLFATGATDGGCKPPAHAVSLSHVNGLGVAVAFPAGAQVGLDLELIDVWRAETVRKGVPLSAEETAWLKVTALPEATALLLLWTVRESLGKALGCGLACKWETLALQRIEVVGEGICSGQFLHHPQFHCASWVGPEAVMSLAFAPA